ncbi:unnamed protein product [Thlaspi arvense]|uniref:Uncharacterized protein n=1 Tax=Thlaspi arvense TaxID=13288 RepID=A0AAU9SUX4_THLAR|nr:unnamed protein product [Thlaspi arvense]
MYPPILSPPLCLVPFTFLSKLPLYPSLSLSLSLTLKFLLLTHFSTSDPKSFFYFISLFCFQSLEISIDPHEVSSCMIDRFIPEFKNVYYLQFCPSSSPSPPRFPLSTSLILSPTCPASGFSSSGFG